MGPAALHKPVVLSILLSPKTTTAPGSARDGKLEPPVVKEYKLNTTPIPVNIIPNVKDNVLSNVKSSVDNNPVIRSTTTGVLTLRFIGENGKSVSVDWGDGSAPTTHTLTGWPNYITYAHDYGGAGGTKQVTIYGDIDYIMTSKLISKI